MSVMLNHDLCFFFKQRAAYEVVISDWSSDVCSSDLAYTQMALFAQVDAGGTLRLVNHLGIDLGDAPEQILERLQAGRFDEADVRHDDAAASAHDYPRH